MNWKPIVGFTVKNILPVVLTAAGVSYGTTQFSQPSVPKSNLETRPIVEVRLNQDDLKRFEKALASIQVVVPKDAIKVNLPRQGIDVTCIGCK